MDKKIQLVKRSRGWAALLDGSTETPLNFQKVVELLEPDALGVHLLKIMFRCFTRQCGYSALQGSQRVIQKLSIGPLSGCR